jgi:hypothetical protein
VSAGAQSGPHRARLFPLPLFAPVARPLCTASARTRLRFKVQRTIVNVTNRSICTLNRLYSSPSLVPFSCSSQPDNHILSCSCCQPSASPSAAQLRVLGHLRDRCAAFVSKARAWVPHSACDIGTSALDLVRSISSAALMQPHPPSTVQPRLQDPLLAAGSPDSPPLSSLPSFKSSAFSSASTAVVPLIATRISLPQQLHVVPMLDVLPPSIASAYTEASSPSLFRSDLTVYTMNFTHPLRPPRVAGSRHEYVQLVARMVALGMLSFTAAPRAVNGVFAVGKDADADRLIIDAQPANRLFVPSPHVALPGPSHLVQLHVPKGRTMYTGKTDLSNYYHHIGLPSWMRPYFALPPLSPAELLVCGLSPDADTPYPMCVTLPMGFSHAVYLAQSCHQHVVYSSGALAPDDSLLCLTSPSVSEGRALHGIVIDDFFLFSLSQAVADRHILAVLAAYRAAGFVVKQSKVVMPTPCPVKVIGFDINGSDSTICLPPESQLSLAESTLAVLRAGTVPGAVLSRLIGRWTWVLMLRRPALAVLQHAYRYCRVAWSRPFTLWPSVRRELCMLLSLLPLLEARLDMPFFARAISSDASELAGGVVATVLTAQLHAQLWPLCSNRHLAVQQSQLNANHPPALPLQPDLTSAFTRFDAFYASVESAPWRTIVSTPWSNPEHINPLELRAALLAVHWALSFPSSLCSRVFLLLDSTVAFFTLWKGRSSSPALLLILRKMSALLLAGGLSLQPGWVPSAVNPADAPSRLAPSRPLGSHAPDVGP